MMLRPQHRPAPVRNVDYWSFMLGGLVELPLPLSYADLQSLPTTETDCVIGCIGSLPGSDTLRQARWRGVSLQTLLDEVSVLPGAHHAHLHAADGYSTSITMEHLRSAVLAYGQDGETLTPDDGGPVRLIVPGLYGYKMPGWIQRINLAETPLAGLWEKRGWSSSGEVQVTSAVVSPRHRDRLTGETTLRGIAYAGAHAITQVEVSIDDGPWMPAPFTQVSPDTLAEWAIHWTPPGSGEYGVKVRAADSAGRIQPETGAQTYPDGASGIHAIVLKV